MSKKMMLLALSVACAAMFALPAVVSATPWHISQTGNFTVHGNAGSLSTPSGTTVTCTTVTSTANTGYTTTTGGNLRLVFHGCTSSGTACTTPGQPSGTILTEQLTFHNVMLPVIGSGQPGILITPGATRFAHFTCAFGLVTVEVKGNGVLGRVVFPTCGGTRTDFPIQFNTLGHGSQTQVDYTGVKYALKKGEETTALDTSPTATFPGNRTLTCT